MKKDVYKKEILAIGEEITALQKDVEDIIVNEELSLKSGLYSKLNRIDKLSKKRSSLILKEGMLFTKTG